MNKTIATRIVTCLVALAALSLILGSSCNSGSQNGNPSQGMGQSTNAVVLTNAVLVTPSIPVWCWAAATSEVLNFYGFTNNSQCQLTSQAESNNYVSCCPTNTSCTNVPSPASLQSLILKFSGSKLIATYNAFPFSFSDVQAQINNGNPILMVYRGSETNGHYAVIYGYDPNGPDVNIQDPLVGAVLVPFGSTFNYDGKPVWTATFTFH